MHSGAWRYSHGQWIPCSIDLYLATEYAEGGDLHNLRGQLSEHDVRRLMWQILTSLEYLHSHNVWHRDLKSANVLLTVKNGQRACMIADFGSARSAGFMPESAEETVDCSRGLQSGSMDFDAQYSEKGKQGTPRHGMEQQSLTQRVCTPCYRAPEVVMSRGGYTSAVDMWSVGCIFGELLQRVSYVGSASTPHLRVSPVFHATGLTNTPSIGDHFDNGPSNFMMRHELEGLFQVIGTPAWACIEAVQSSAWRCYLRNLPLKAGTLHRRFGSAGEMAVDLLSRMLTFDPSRRCSPGEAMSHEYFMQYWTNERDLTTLGEREESTTTSAMWNAMHDKEIREPITSLGDPDHYHQISNPAKALMALEKEMAQICAKPCRRGELQTMIMKECELFAETRSKKLRRSLSEKFNNATSTLAMKCMREGPSEFTRLLNEGLVIDPNTDKSMKPESFGPGRLPHVADFSKAYLDTEKHLAANRQQEWTMTSGCGPATHSCWGVSLAPPGTDESTMDPQMKSIIRSQQLR